MTSLTRLARMGAIAVLAAFAGAAAGCSQFVDGQITPDKKQISADSRDLLFQKGLREESPIFIRIFKQESELEVWKAKEDGRYYHYKTYPICNWSGNLGPKQKKGDMQAPEGFYRVRAGQLNPASKYHLAFNLGYPNRFDRAHNRTGQHLMVHGDCKSAGCYAMTDAVMEEIYALVRESLQGGQTTFAVHAFPFRMTAENMKKYRKHKWASFWRNLKQGYDQFEKTRVPPKIDVCERRYLVNAVFLDDGGDIDPKGACPIYQKMSPGTLPATLRPSNDVMAQSRTRPTFQYHSNASRSVPPAATVGFGYR